MYERSLSMAKKMEDIDLVHTCNLLTGNKFK